MNFSQLVDRLVADTVDTSLVLFLPELALCGSILVLLLVRLFGADRAIPGYAIALGGSIVAFLFALDQFIDIRTAGMDAEPQYLFTGLLVHDWLTSFFKMFLLLFLVLVVVLTIFTGIPDDEDSPDFYSLLIGSAIGMLLMGSANNLLILFLGVEMASVPSYAMVGFLKGRRASSEAALKFVVYGAGAAGVLLYGTSLIAGLTGTTDLTAIASRINVLMTGAESFGISNPTVLGLSLGLLMIFVGMAFKLSLFPFHFWCPDAFEGAPAEVAGYLSVASKGAAFVLLMRVCLSFVDGPLGELAPLYTSLGIGIGVIAVLTMTFGNLAAYGQTNVKRLLAYSTIAHAGYMLLAVSVMVVCLAGSQDNPEAGRDIATNAMQGLLYYLSVYLFMNLGAFAVVALIRNQTFGEEISDYRGLSRQAPLLCAGMLVCMFSLIGLPPMGGFIGKLYIFMSAFEAGSVHGIMYVFLVLAGINTVFSLFYYLNVLKAMYIADREVGARPVDVPAASGASVYILLVSVPVLLLGTIAGPLTRTTLDVASYFLR